MICARCGAVGAAGAAYCSRCSMRLNAGARVPPAKPSPAPLQAALSAASPTPRSGRLSTAAATALRPGIAGKPQWLVAAGAASPRVRAMPSPGRAELPRGLSPQLPPWAWATGGLLLCTTLAFMSQNLALHLPSWPTDWVAPATAEDAPASPGGVVREASDAAAPAQPTSPGLAAGELADAINAELRRLGVDTVTVQVQPDGTAAASGRVASAQDRDDVLRWLMVIPGVARVVDALEVEAPAREVPPPRAAVAPDRPVRERAAPEVSAPVAPQAAPRATIPEPPPARIEPPPVEPAAVMGAVQRELARLSLTRIAVEVDASLQVTLRGTAPDLARKGLAIAAARAATPTGRVRDLVFVVEE
jgi:hypothetical protein